MVWILEELIPRPLPWLKPGLANIATILAITLVGPIEAITVAALRVLIGAFLLGKIGSAAFLISICSAITSAAAMAALVKSRCPLSIYGISITGALVHALTQLLMAGLILYSPSIALKALPIVVLPAIPTGTVVAFLAGIVLRNSRFPRE